MPIPTRLPFSTRHAFCAPTCGGEGAIPYLDTELNLMLEKDSFREYTPFTRENISQKRKNEKKKKFM
ncbi:hypothetical protein POVWA1_038060 [Plasmodium ovale wallikeri]|uniref:Uncharacterized protein n=1 Tax=Plasmodium ovale wallikeri TaxID=864142 RepID=A0A1A8Z3W2_PLAOA|nr:hypothetical protein POVWA1_038060 [Plasmodium ovale wallikeri]